MPIYYLLILMVLVMYIITRPNSKSARDYYHAVPFLLTYTSNWRNITAGNMGVMWSLATEEQFYLVWPAIEKFLKPWWVAVALVVVLVVNQLINFGIFDPLISEVFGPISLPILHVTFTPIRLGSCSLISFTLVRHLFPSTGCWEGKVLQLASGPHWFS